jgi:hypothetical protein
MTKTTPAAKLNSAKTRNRINKMVAGGMTVAEAVDAIFGAGTYASWGEA